MYSFKKNAAEKCVYTNMLYDSDAGGRPSVCDIIKESQ